MKKDFIKTSIFAFIVSIVVVFAVLEIKKFQGEEDVKEIENRVVAIGSDEVSKIKYKDYILERDGKKFTWKITSPYTDYLNYRVTEDWVSKGLSQEGRNLSDGGEKLNWQEFSLDHSDGKMIYTTVGGDTATVQLSKKEAFDGSTYLRVMSSKKGEQLYSSTAEWKEVFTQKIEKLRSLQLFNWETPSPSAMPKKISFYRKGKKYLSLEKSGKWKSAEHETWTFDDAKVDSYLSELKTYLHEGFVSDKTSKKVKERVKLKNKLATIVLNTDTNEDYSLGFYRGQYAIASYRPEHILKVDNVALSGLMVSPLDLRSFDDVDANFPNGEYTGVKIKIRDKYQKFNLKDSIWVLDAKEAKKKTFNGARVFIFLDQIKKLNYRRYISDRGVVFKSAKKRIYLLKEGKEVIRYSVGQNFPCEVKSSRANCVLIATNAVKKAYMVVLRKEVNELFKFSFKDGAK